MASKRGLQVVVNGEVYSVLPNDKEKPTVVIAAVLEPFSDVAQYWSEEALRAAISKAEELAEEVLEKRVKRMDWNKVKMPPLTVFYNIILAAEGMSLLPGFGTCAAERGEGGRTRVLRHYYDNPEYKTTKKG